MKKTPTKKAAKKSTKKKAVKRNVAKTKAASKRATVNIAPNFPVVFQRFINNSQHEAGKLLRTRNLQIIAPARALIASLNIALASVSDTTSFEQFRDTFAKITTDLAATADALQSEADDADTV